MSSIEMAYSYPREVERAKQERWPVLIPVGTMEYHSAHCPYGCDALTAIGIILLDYVLAFTVIGFAGCFNKTVKDRRLSIVLGIVVTFFGRFVCHYLSGVLIWEAMWPNELGWASSVWSIAYNGSYMLPEIIITAVVAWLSYAPLKKYWHGEDLPKAR